jgi:cytosylglucuronate decarboxylase
MRAMPPSIGPEKESGGRVPGSHKGPRVLFIRVLEACNAGCFMCGFARSDDPYQFGVDEMAALLRGFVGSEIQLVRFTGGEPLLLPHLPELVRMVAATGRRTSVITNGWHLAERAGELATAGLSQIIASLDGPSPATHDRYRRVEGLFDRLVTGLQEVRAASTGVRRRVNTVVGPNNVRLLPSIWDLLVELGVDQWSLIPLKLSRSPWSRRPLEDDETALVSLRDAVASTGPTGPSILGPGLRFLGRSPEERARLHGEGRNMTPRAPCGLVDEVRYLTPKDGRVYPCNCIPHRLGGHDLSERASSSSFETTGLAGVRDWLRDEGPRRCTGCEPANVALAEGAIDLDADPLGF